MSSNHIIDICWYKMSNEFIIGSIKHAFNRFFMLIIAVVDDDASEDLSCVTRFCVDLSDNSYMITSSYE